MRICRQGTRVFSTLAQLLQRFLNPSYEDKVNRLLCRFPILSPFLHFALAENKVELEARLVSMATIICLTKFTFPWCVENVPCVRHFMYFRTKNSSISPRPVQGLEPVVKCQQSAHSTPSLWCESGWLCRHTDTGVPSPALEQPPTLKMMWRARCRQCSRCLRTMYGHNCDQLEKVAWATWIHGSANGGEHAEWLCPYK